MHQQGSAQTSTQELIQTWDFLLLAIMSLAMGVSTRQRGCETLFLRHLFPQADSPFLSRISSTCDMSDPSPPSHFKVLFDPALHDYKRQMDETDSDRPPTRRATRKMRLTLLSRSPPLFKDKHEAVLKRLDRLTQDEARTTAAQTLEVVYGPHPEYEGGHRW